MKRTAKRQRCGGVGYPMLDTAGTCDRCDRTFDYWKNRGITPKHFVEIQAEDESI